MRELKVIKRDGTREHFSPDKLHRSISIALRKREIGDETIDNLITSITRELEQLGENEFESSKVGEVVMRKLATTDPVAYVRYASVYRDFEEPEDFSRFVKEEMGAVRTKKIDK